MQGCDLITHTKIPLQLQKWTRNVFPPTYLVSYEEVDLQRSFILQRYPGRNEQLAWFSVEVGAWDSVCDLLKKGDNSS